MKITMKKSFAVIMALVMCVSVLFGMNLSVFAADTNTVNYVYDGTKVYNWGTRETEATFLSPMAIEFYSDNNVSLDALLALSGSSTESGVPSSALYKELNELMKDNHDYITSYDATKNLFKYTDCQNGGGKISSFYSGKEIGPSWDSAWNREHVWPNSKGDAAGNGENDLMMLRPTSTSENSSRGNKAYGTATTTQYYNPNDEGNGAYDLRGDVARIILYQYVRWECTNTGSEYNSNSIFGSNGVIESKDVLLDWIEADPVDTWELGRNDAAESILGTRNVFVDYPELAFDLFNESVPTGYTTPSAGVSVEGTTGTGGSGNTGDSGSDTPIVAGEEVLFELGTDGDASHKDGSSKTSYTETVDGYTLNITDGTNFYTGALDAKGNSAIKMGTSSKAGSFSLTVPDNVIKVIFNVAGYKSKTVTVSVNGASHSITTTSDNGAYTAIEVDTTSTKNITFATSTGYRCMINSITYVFAGSSDDDTVEDNKTFVDTGDVIVSGSEDAFPENTTINVNELAEGDDGFETATTALADIASKFIAYDITPSATLNEGATITLTLGIPDEYNADNVCIIHIPDDGVINPDEDILSSSIDKIAKTVSAEVSHFSTYAVADTTPAADDSNQGGSATTEPTTIVFELGDNGSESHNDGSSKTSYTETVDGYTLNLTSGTKFYTGARDAKGNSAIKLGTSSAAGSFSLTAPDDVTKVIFYVAQYKSNTTKIKVNSTSHTITTASNNGAYTAIEVDTSTTKTITFTTVSGGYRCMIDKIEYVIPGSSGGDTPETPSYTITAESNNTNYGTVELSGNVITAKAKAGYTLADGDAAYTVTSGTATVVRNDNTFIVTVTSDATITINFVALPVYTVQFSENGVLAEPMTKYVGGQITLPAHTSDVPDGYEFKAWAEQENETDTSKWLFEGNKYTVNGDATLYAQYSEVSNVPTSTATITFDNVSKRTSYSTAQQIWYENGVTVTNDKGSSTSNVNEAVNPVRFYANSNVTIACKDMTELVITADSSEYAKAWKDTIDAGNYPDVKLISVSGSKVTIEFNNAIDTFVVTKLKAQSRVASMTITKLDTGSVANEYTVTYIENGTETGSSTIEEGTVIPLPNDTATPSNKNFVGWATTENATSGILAAGATYTVNADITFYAQYTDKIVESADHSFVKITENLNDWSGTYLIVYEEGNKAFNGALSTLKTANGTDVNITNSKINATDETLAATFTIEAVENGYAIKSASGYYIGRKSSNTDSNDLLFNKTTKYVNSISMVDGVVNIVSGNTYLRWNDGSSFFRYYKSGTYTSQKPIALYKLDVGEIDGAQVTVGADLSVKYYVDVVNAENTDVADLSMRFTIGTDAPITVNAVKEGSQFTFTFPGLAPQRMGDIIKAELLLNGGVIDTKDNYSIRQNVLNLINANPENEELKQFVSDMLYYGAAAQTYTGYKKNELVTADLEDVLNEPLDEPLTEAYNKLNLTVPTGDVRFKSATIWFDAVNKLIVKVNNPNSNDIKVYVTREGDERKELYYDATVGGYMTDEIKVTDFHTTYTFQVCDASDNVLQTLTYSVNSYAYSKQNSTNPAMAELALALFRLGQSAENL